MSESTRSFGQGRTACLLQELLRFDTRNPPGETASLAKFLRDRFVALGAEVDLVTAPRERGPAHVIARLCGDGSKRPVLLAAHSDVVPVEQDRWSVDPLGGVARDGWVLGRGAMDFKGGLAVFATAFAMLAEKTIKLARDVILLSEGDEESGPHNTRWLADQCWDKIDCEFALNEGGWIFQDRAGVARQVNITVRDSSTDMTRTRSEQSRWTGKLDISKTLVSLAAAFLAMPAFAQGSGSATLDAVRARGELACGVSGTTPGFSFVDSQGVMDGSDADICHAVAAAALGDAGKVKFVTLTSTNRFTALQSGEVDLLARGVTWTLGREASLGLLFTTVSFYDGTGFLVKASSGVKSAKQLDGATICVLPGTSTELAVTDYFRHANMKFSPVLIDGTSPLRAAFLSGRCDAYATDASALAGFRFSEGGDKADLVLLPEIISKEPLAPVVRKGDDKWFDLVRWTQFAMDTAEELGITSGNVDTFLASTDPDVRRLLGVEGDLGKAMGLDNRWAYTVIKQVGNSSEVWDRDIAPLGIPRGHNRPTAADGWVYAPPLR